MGYGIIGDKGRLLSGVSLDPGRLDMGAQGGNAIASYLCGSGCAVELGRGLVAVLTRVLVEISGRRDFD